MASDGDYKKIISTVNPAQELIIAAGTNFTGTIEVIYGASTTRSLAVIFITSAAGTLTYTLHSGTAGDWSFGSFAAKLSMLVDSGNLILINGTGAAVEMTMYTRLQSV